MVDALGAEAKGYGEHVVQRASAGVDLRVYVCHAVRTVSVQMVDHVCSFEVEDVRVRLDGLAIQPEAGYTAVLPPVLPSARSGSTRLPGELLYHRLLYGDAVIPLPTSTVWLLMNISFLSEKTAPWVAIRSFAMPGSDTMRKSWLPSHTE